MVSIPKAVYGVLAIVVAILVIASVLIPVVEDSSKTRDYLSNPTSGVQLYDEGDTVISHAAETSGLSITVDGVAATLAAQTYIVMSEEIIIYVGNNYVDARVTQDGYGLISLEEYSWTFTISDGVYTLDYNDGSDKTVTGSINSNRALHVDADGDWMLASEGVKFNYGAKMAAAHVSSTFFFYAWGSAGSSLDGTVWIAPSGTDRTALELESSAEGDYRTYTSASISYNNSEIPLVVILPVEYYQLIDEGGTVSVLLGVIPLLAILAVVMVTARLLGGRE